MIVVDVCKKAIRYQLSLNDIDSVCLHFSRGPWAVYVLTTYSIITEPKRDVCNGRKRLRVTSDAEDAFSLLHIEYDFSILYDNNIVQ